MTSSGVIYDRNTPAKIKTVVTNIPFNGIPFEVIFENTFRASPFLAIVYKVLDVA